MGGLVVGWRHESVWVCVEGSRGVLWLSHKTECADIQAVRVCGSEGRVALRPRV